MLDFCQGAVSVCGATLVLSLAKDSGADAYDRGTSLYGYGPVTAHAHGEFVPCDLGVALT